MARLNNCPICGGSDSPHPSLTCPAFCPGYQTELGKLHIRLPDTKTGPRKVSLSPRAVRVLKSIPRMADNPWVIPGRVEGRPMRNIDEAWGVVCDLAGLRDTRIHDCRHSFASRHLPR